MTCPLLMLLLMGHWTSALATSIPITSTATISSTPASTLTRTGSTFFSEIQETISLDVAGNCSANVELSWCSLDLVADPDGCLTFGGLLSAVLGNLDVADQLTDQLTTTDKNNPASWRIDTAYIDRCGTSFILSTSIPYDFQIVPNYLNLVEPNISFAYDFATDDYDFNFASNLMLGKKTFRVAVAKSSGRLELSGRALDAEVRVGQFLIDITSSLFPGDTVAGVIDQAGLGGFVLTDIGLTFTKTDSGMAVALSFLAGNGERSGRFQVLVNRGSFGTDKGLGVVVSGEWMSVSVVEMINKLTGFDLSELPIIGNLNLPSLALVVSSKVIGSPIIPLQLASFPQITTVQKGISLIFSTSLDQSNDTISFYISYSPPRSFSFSLLPGSKIPVRTLLVGVLDSLDVDLPSWLKLDQFLSQSIEEFSYDTTSKSLHLAANMHEPISLIDEGLVFTECQLDLEVSFAKNPGSKYGVRLQSTWVIRDIDVALAISKPLGSKVWMATGKPDVDIPVGALLQKFAVSVIPAGPIRNGAKNIGFDAFLIADPTVQVFLGSVVAAKVSGTAEFGSWKASSVEVLIGKLSGATVMAMGLVIGRVPLTTLVKEVTDGSVDLGVLPGARLLDHTTLALVFASQFVPRGSENIRFESPLLGEMDITEGMGIAASFAIPSDCQNDKFCAVLQRILGTGTALILKGSINVPNIRLQALVPSNISIITGLVMTDVGFEVEVGIRMAFGVTGKLTLSEPQSIFENPVVLIGSLGLSNSGAYLQMSMKGIWKKAFGQRWVTVGNLHLRVAISPDPILISVLELGGEAIIGDLDNPNVRPIEASIYVGMDRVSLTQSFFSGRINRLTIPAIVQAFKPSVSLPTALNEIGFPQGLNCSIALSSRILPNGVVIPRGFYFTGMLSIFDFKVWTDARISLNGVYFNMTANPFEIANGLIALKGLKGDKGPNIYINVGWNPPVAEIKIQAEVKVLILSSAVNVTIDHKGIYFEISGKMLDLFEATLKLQASYSSLKEASFMVEGTFKQGLLMEVQNKVIHALDRYRVNSDKAIVDAQKAIDNSRRTFEEASKSVARQRNKVDSAQGSFDAAVARVSQARRNLERQKSKFNEAGNSVRRARDAVNRKNRDLDRAVSSLRGAERSVLSKNADFNRAVNSVNSKKADVTRAQRKLDQEREKFRRKERSCPSACRKRRSTDDTFLSSRSAKTVLTPRDIFSDTALPTRRVRRGWGWFEERKEDVAERGKEIARRTKCAALQAARQTCLAGLRAIQGAINAASGSLNGAKAGLSAASKVVDASRHSLTVAQGVLRGAQGTVNGARAGLAAATAVLGAAEATARQAKVLVDAAQGVLRVAEEVTDKSRVSLQVAKGVLVAAEETVRTSQVSLDATVGVLEGVRHANRFGVKVAEAVASRIGLVDIREISFHVSLAVAETGSFGARIHVSFFGKGAKTYSFHVNLRSMSSLVDILVDKSKGILGL